MPPSIAILRSITAYRVEKFCVDFKIINYIPIPIFFKVNIYLAKIWGKGVEGGIRFKLNDKKCCINM